MNKYKIVQHQFKPGHDDRRYVKQRGAISITTILKKISKKRVIHLDEIEGCTRRMTVAEKLALKLIANALNGDMVAMKEYNNRIDGKVAQPMEIAGPGGVPLAAPNIYIDPVLGGEKPSE